MEYKLSKEEWISSCGDLSERDKGLLSRAYDTLYKNRLYSPNAPWGDVECISPWTGPGSAEGIWNWDSAFHAYTVSRFDTRLAEGCLWAFMQYQMESGQFPDMILADGYVEDNYTKPPVMAWAIETVYNRNKDIDFLKKYYPMLVKNEAWWVKERCYDGLFYYTANNHPEENDYLHPKFESGLDNSPRWDKNIVNMWAIDLNGYMVMTYHSLSFMAKELGEDSSEWDKKAKKLSMLINEKLFDSDSGKYSDRNYLTGNFSDVLTPCSYVPLFAGIATKETAEKMLALANDKDKLYPFMPSVSYDDPTYSEGYWRGPVWLNIAYFAAKGLKNYGFNETADAIKEAILNMVDKNKDGIHENYNSKTQLGIHYPSFSWSAAFVIEFILNF